MGRPPRSAQNRPASRQNMAIDDGGGRSPGDTLGGGFGDIGSSIGRQSPAGTVPESSKRAGLGDAAPRAVRADDVPRATRRPGRPAGARDLPRQTTRPGAVVVMGREGEQLTRRRTHVGDKFHVPENEIPTGWTYQWNPVTVVNQNMVESQVLMHQNGWRPVPCERHDGRWFPPGTKGAIIVDGLRLEERPLALTREALEEDKTRARMQVRDQTDSLRLTQKQLPGSQVARERRAGGGMRMEIDPGLDIPAPSYQDPDEES